MSKALLKVSKILPRLHNASDSERLQCLTAIERLLATEDLDFVLAGVKLGEFLTEVMGISEDILIPKVEPPKSNGGWTNVSQPAPAPQPTVQPGVGPGWQSSARPQAAPRPSYTPPPRPAPPPPPPPPPRPRIDPRTYRGASKAEKLACIADIKAKVTLTSTELQNLCIVEFHISSGLPVKRAGQSLFETLSTKL